MAKKQLNLVFISPAENQAQPTKEAKIKKEPLTGYISNTGKIVFPEKISSLLPISFDGNAVKIGIEQGKRKVKSLYVVPATEADQESFTFEKTPRGYTLDLSIILKANGIEFDSTKYIFNIEDFEYQGITSLELELSLKDAAPKPPYTGKPRGRKPKIKVE